VEGNTQDKFGNIEESYNATVRASAFSPRFKLPTSYM
jgi:hypothetical protein